MVFHMAPYWREAGLRVTFLFGTRRFVPADLLFLHVNLSVVPDSCLELAARYPAVVNGYAVDIRKSTISESLVRPGDGWDGPVIVKSDLNFGGEPEYLLGGNRLLRATRAGRLLLRFGPRRRRISPLRRLNDYPIFDRASEVPRDLADDPRVVVERFLPEREDDLFHLRTYIFLGDRTTCLRTASPDPLVKATNTVRTEYVEPHPAVEVWRKRFRLDFGKIDYVLHEGTPVLLDTNKTLGVSPATSPGLEERRRFHATGIDAYFR